MAKNKVLLLSLSISLLILILSPFIYAQQRIFSGYFDDEGVKLSPVLSAHPAVVETPEGYSGQYLLFKDSSGRIIKDYHIAEQATESGYEKNYFYFLTEVPENTGKIEFFYFGEQIGEAILSSENPEIETAGVYVNPRTGNNEVFWRVSDADSRQIFLNVFYKEQEKDSWMPLFIDMEIENTGSFEIPLGEIKGGENIFKFVVSDFFNEDSFLTETIIIYDNCEQGEGEYCFAPNSLPECNQADFNGDGIVNIGDLAIFSKNFGKKDCFIGNSWCGHTDINKDGIVNIGDLALFSKNYKKGNYAECVVL